DGRDRESGGFLRTALCSARHSLAVVSECRPAPEATYSNRRQLPTSCYPENHYPGRFFPKPSRFQPMPAPRGKMTRLLQDLQLIPPQRKVPLRQEQAIRGQGPHFDDGRIADTSLRRDVQPICSLSENTGLMSRATTSERS